MFPHKAVCVILIARVLLNLQLMAMPSAISKIVFEYIIPGAGRRRRPVVDLYKTIGFLTRHRCRCRRRLGHRMHQYESLKGRIYVTSRSAKKPASIATAFEFIATKNTDGSQQRTNESTGIRSGCRHFFQWPVCSGISKSIILSRQRIGQSSKKIRRQTISMKYQL
jgi:hypothetical protein